MTKFNKEGLEFFLPDSFKGLSKEYILDKIFDEKIQQNWIPQKGDIIVGETGNIFVISGTHPSKNEGGTLYFFGGGLCNRNGGILLDSTYSYVANKTGLQYVHYQKDSAPYNNPYWCKISDFRYVPYPHEL